MKRLIMASEGISSIIEKHKKNGDGIISMLEEVQSKYSYLPRQALISIAEETGRSLTEIYGVATFYRAFSLEPRGNHLVSVCLGTACHVRGGQSIADEVQQQLGVLPGKTTPDKEFTLETVNCLGACALGPVAVVDGRYYSKVKRTKVKSILKETLESSGKTETIDPNAIPVNVSCIRCNHTLMDEKQQIDGKPSIKFTVSFGNTHGSLRLSSLYGSYNFKTELTIPEGKVVDIFCPHCNVELQGAGRCPECNEKMVPLLIRGGGILQFCTKKGCKGHLLDLF